MQKITPRTLPILLSLLLAACLGGDEGESETAAPNSSASAPTTTDSAQNPGGDATTPTSMNHSDTHNDNGYDYLNTLRTRAGMTSFHSNSLLQKAAANHAAYLTNNSATGHHESEGLAGFSGVSAAERAVAVGYPSRQVAENVSSSYGSEESSYHHSIDGLMSAIYHRLAFLSFDSDEVGLDLSGNGEATNYVYNMGNSAIASLCEESSFSGVGRYYTAICSDSTKRLEAGAYLSANETIATEQPDRVLWPAEGDRDVPPVFFEEDPDPLPAYSVSGYPISVQFNPAKVASAAVTRFELFDDSGVAISDTLLLSADNDPNQKLSPLEFVLFPLQRLQWAKTYRVELEYTVANLPASLTWSFTTRDPGTPLYTITTEGENISASAGDTFVVYMPPTHATDSNGSVNWSYSGYSSGDSVEVELIDKNTLRLEIIASDGKISVSFHDKVFTITL
ncbi:MAG: CAP domain-containing protein [Gammaproteobacteria bacterium]|nr:CAP domain-containing protein [Gammaproteobacteria bacterium]